MQFATLDAAYERYRSDHDTAHELFQLCIAFAKDIIGKSNPDFDEAAQDSAWTAWERFNTLRPETLFSAWYLRVVRSKVRDYGRKAKRRQTREAQDFSRPQPAFTSEEQDQMRQRAGKERDTVDLLLAGHTLDDLAAQLQVTVKTIRRRLHAAGKEASNGSIQ